MLEYDYKHAAGSVEQARWSRWGDFRTLKSIGLLHDQSISLGTRFLTQSKICRVEHAAKRGAMRLLYGHGVARKWQRIGLRGSGAKYSRSPCGSALQRHQ